MRLILPLAVLCLVGWLQHIFTCFMLGKWGFLIAGAIFLPIGVIHGWGRLLGLW